MASLAKPIKNTALDYAITKKREKAGAKMISTYGSQRSLVRENNKPWVFVYISDQYPPNQERAVKADFFGRPTLFLHGAQQLALKKNYPLYATKIERKRRGHYTMTLEVLHPNPSASTEEALTQLYANFLERTIKKDPASWLWSHKRWKADGIY